MTLRHRNTAMHGKRDFPASSVLYQERKTAELAKEFAQTANPLSCDAGKSFQTDVTHTCKPNAARQEILQAATPQWVQS